MPKGCHYGRTQTRPYTSEYQRIPAKLFCNLLDAPVGNYSINSDQLSDEHKAFKLIETERWPRIAVFTIKGKEHLIPLQLDNRSASNKLYLVCPYCQHQRQHLYAVKNAYSCRKCLGLHYASQSERHKERLMRKIRNKRKKLWGADWPDVNNMFENSMYWAKPKCLHWKTFYKAQEELKQLERQYWPMIDLHFNSMFGKQFSHLL